jgi:hypothetical protein
MESLQGIGSEWYSAMVDIPSLGVSPISPAPGVTLDSLCPRCIETGHPSPLPLRAFGLLTYMRFPHLRAGLGLQLTFNDPNEPIAMAAPVDGSSGVPAPVNVLAVTGSAFVDAEVHLGPLYPYVGLDGQAGEAGYSQSTPLRRTDLSSQPLAFVAARAGLRLYLGSNMAVGAFYEKALLGPSMQAVGLALTFPEVPAT